jgi:RNA polymerase sigma factor (sigma-70 family)
VRPLAARTTLDPGEDARLVELCLAGDARAWDMLVRRHERLVYAVARSYRLGDPDLGDVFQDVFAALVRGLPRLRDARALVRWLSSTTDRIARATALRRRREAARSDTGAIASDTVASGDPDVGTDLETLEEQALIRLALAALPEGCRRLLTALYYEDPPLPYAALARRLGMPIGSLGPTRARCLDRMRQVLAAMETAGIRPESGDTYPSTAGSLPRRSGSSPPIVPVPPGPMSQNTEAEDRS